MDAGPEQTDPTARVIRLRYAGHCRECGEGLERGQRAWWESNTKTVVCTRCRSEEPQAREDDPAPSLDLDRGIAGGSARQEYERRHRKREEGLERKWGKLAGVVKFLSDDPRSTTVWGQGSVGERILADYLSKTLGDRAVALHDRRVPGSRGNIDHIVVAATGVWVIDTKRWSGKVERRDVGGWFKVDQRLYVGGRERPKAVEGMAWQIDAVTKVLNSEGLDTPLRAALCFVEAEWGLFAKPFELKGVRVSGPKSLAVAISEEGPLEPGDVMDVARALANALPSKAS
jgi:hypothetical protein